MVHALPGFDQFAQLGLFCIHLALQTILSALELNYLSVKLGLTLRKAALVIAFSTLEHSHLFLNFRLQVLNLPIHLPNLVANEVSSLPQIFERVAAALW